MPSVVEEGHRVVEEEAFREAGVLPDLDEEWDTVVVAAALHFREDRGEARPRRPAMDRRTVNTVPGETFSSMRTLLDHSIVGAF